jgi:AraC family transcriptional regulator
MEMHTDGLDPRKRPVAGAGRIIGWPGGSLWIGHHLAPIQEHAHHAIQISLAMEGRFRIQADGWSEARGTRGMVVMPDRRHRFDGCGAWVATLFVEPNSARGAALRERFAGFDIALLPDDEVREAVRYLHAQYTAAAPDDLMAQFAQGAVCRIAGNPAMAPSEDPRITTALAWMHARLATPIRLEEVAATVHLSPSRFRHLFVTQTGTSLRAWLLWARVARAVEYAFQGCSWTGAAHEAGFADAAHLTRTCRRVFGVAPTMLVPSKLTGPESVEAG